MIRSIVCFIAFSFILGTSHAWGYSTSQEYIDLIERHFEKTQGDQRLEFLRKVLELKNDETYSPSTRKILTDIYDATMITFDSCGVLSDYDDSITTPLMKEWIEIKDLRVDPDELYGFDLISDETLEYYSAEDLIETCHASNGPYLIGVVPHYSVFMYDYKNNTFQEFLGDGGYYRFFTPPIYRTVTIGKRVGDSIEVYVYSAIYDSIRYAYATYNFITEEYTELNVCRNTEFIYGIAQEDREEGDLGYWEFTCDNTLTNTREMIEYIKNTPQKIAYREIEKMEIENSKSSTD